MLNLWDYANIHNHENWGYTGNEVTLVEVSKYSSEYRRVSSNIGSLNHYQVEKIVRIQNPYLWVSYLLKREEYVCQRIRFQEMTLYHETYRENVESIAKYNFDWRRSGRRAKYGAGVSFSYSAEYANTNSSNRGAMFVVRVLVGNTEIGSWGKQLPSTGCDTTTSGGVNCNVYVKYNDNEFYPEYVAYLEPKR